LDEQLGVLASVTPGPVTPATASALNAGAAVDVRRVLAKVADLGSELVLVAARW
jgi:hypothetical protein